jgi:hypothetical protein
MARVATETTILDITVWLVPGCALLGFAADSRQPLLYYVAGGILVVGYFITQYFRWRKQG